jgi:hypothetical protein
LAWLAGFAPRVVLVKPAKRRPDAASDEIEYRVKRRQREVTLLSSEGEAAAP